MLKFLDSWSGTQRYLLQLYEGLCLNVMIGLLGNQEDHENVDVRTYILI